MGAGQTIVHVFTVADHSKRTYFGSVPGCKTLFESSEPKVLLQSIMEQTGATSLKTVTCPGHATTHEVTLVHEILQADAAAREEQP